MRPSPLSSQLLQVVPSLTAHAVWSVQSALQVAVPTFPQMSPAVV
jgi:hypothetical protein